MRSLILAAVLVPALLASGCAARVYAGPPATAPAPYGPDLVYAGPGVQVIADYDEPIFFADGFYWRSYGGNWYRSSYYTGGWIFYSRPPVVITRIDRPHTYVHYRPMGWHGRGAPPPQRVAPAPAAGPSWRGQATAPPRQAPAPGPSWRGQATTPPPRPAPAPAPGPSWRGRDNRGHDHGRDHR